MNNDFVVFSLRLALIVAAFGVICGALGAHALSAILDESGINAYKSAVLYHLLGSISVILFIGLKKFFVERWLKLSIRLMFFGILFFSGSIYLLALNQIWQIEAMKWLGPITPIGGLFLIFSFLILSFAIKEKAEE